MLRLSSSWWPSVLMAMLLLVGSGRPGYAQTTCTPHLQGLSTSKLSTWRKKYNLHRNFGNPQHSVLKELAESYKFWPNASAEGPQLGQYYVQRLAHSWPRSDLAKEIEVQIVGGQPTGHWVSPILAKENKIGLVFKLRTKNPQTPFGKHLKFLQDRFGQKDPVIFLPSEEFEELSDGSFWEGDRHQPSIFTLGPQVLQEILQAKSLPEINNHPVWAHEIFHGEQFKNQQQGRFSKVSGMAKAARPIFAALSGGLLGHEDYLDVDEAYAHIITVKLIIQKLKHVAAHGLRRPSYGQKLMRQLSRETARAIAIIHTLQTMNAAAYNALLSEYHRQAFGEKPTADFFLRRPLKIDHQDPPSIVIHLASFTLAKIHQDKHPSNEGAQSENKIANLQYLLPASLLVESKYALNAPANLLALAQLLQDQANYLQNLQTKLLTLAQHWPPLAQQMAHHGLGRPEIVAQLHTLQNLLNVQLEFWPTAKFTANNYSYRSLYYKLYTYWQQWFNHAPPAAHHPMLPLPTLPAAVDILRAMSAH